VAALPQIAGSAPFAPRQTMPGTALAHRYFDTAHAILQTTVDDDLPELERAIRSLSESLPDDAE
jgi:uncharacterized protein with HEPN domain